MIRKTVVVVDSLETGRALRKLREQHGTSVRSLAGALGISPMAVSFYERGLRGVTPRTARSFAVCIFELAKKKMPKHFRLSPEDEE